MFIHRALTDELLKAARSFAAVIVTGPRRSGKTTLLRVITGELEPDAGTIEKAEKLRIVYFEQNRESLDASLTLKRALAPEGDQVVYRDRTLHVASWAKRFLFPPRAARNLRLQTVRCEPAASSSRDCYLQILQARPFAIMRSSAAASKESAVQSSAVFRAIVM